RVNVPCLGNCPRATQHSRLGGSLFSPRHQLFPIEERSAAVAGRSSFMKAPAAAPRFHRFENPSFQDSKFFSVPESDRAPWCIRSKTICRFASGCRRKYSVSGPWPGFAARRQRADGHVAKGRSRLHEQRESAHQGSANNDRTV